MILMQTIDNAALYGGLAGFLIAPLMILWLVVLSLLGLATLDFSVITFDGVAKFAIVTLLLGIGGVIIGGIFGFCYGMILSGMKQFFGMEYPDSCQLINYISLFIITITLVLFLVTLLIGLSDARVFLFNFLIPIFCWTPLIPFILLNRKLIRIID